MQDGRTSFSVLLLSGSTRRPSYTRALTIAMAAKLRGYGAACTHWCLRDRPLPVADPSYHTDPAEHPDPTVRELVDLATKADAFVLATPVYHNSYSGVLKNGLDHLAIQHFQHKPVALLGHGGHRATHGVEHLRIVVRGLLGVAIPSQLCTARLDFVEADADEFAISDSAIAARLERVALELMIYTQSLAPLSNRTPAH